MADKRLEQLPTATTLGSSDLIHISQSGIDKRINSDVLVAQLNSGVAFNFQVKEESSTERTLSISDRTSYIRCLNVGITSIIVPPTSDVPWTLGDQVMVRRQGGKVNISGGSGVTVNGGVTGLSLLSGGQDGILTYVGSNTWDLETGGTTEGINGTVTDYDPLTTYTEIDEWVRQNDIVYRPDASLLPIGPEAFDVSKWIIAQITGADDLPLEINGENTNVASYLNSENVEDLAELRSNLASSVYGSGAKVSVNQGGKGWVIDSTGLTDDSYNVIIEGSQAWVRENDLGGVNGKWLGIKGGGQPTSTEFEAACRTAMAAGWSIYLPIDEYYLESDIDLTDREEDLVIYGDYISVSRTARTVPRARITFNDDGTSTTGRIGLHLNTSNTALVLSNIIIQTLVSGGDARSSVGDFTGIACSGIGTAVNGCRIDGFPIGIMCYDFGYADWGGNYYRGNKTAIKHAVKDWPSGTSFHDDRSQSVRNTIVYDCPGLFHSHWSNSIHEYADIVINDIQPSNSVTNCYFEHLGTASVYSASTGADLLTINNFYNSSTDRPILSNDTGVFGFDRCGPLDIDQNRIQLRALRFCTRSGFDAGYIQASRNSSGQIQLTDVDYNVEGNVPAIEGGGESTDRLIKSICVHGGNIYGLPDGWTYTNTTVGQHEIEFDGNIKLPNIQVTVTPTSTSNSNEATYKLIMKENSSGNWSSFRNASGFTILTELNSTASDNVVISITMII